MDKGLFPLIFLSVNFVLTVSFQKQKLKTNCPMHKTKGQILSWNRLVLPNEKHPPTEETPALLTTAAYPARPRQELQPLVSAGSRADSR